MTYKLQPLLPGDTIDIIAPGFACTQEEIAETLLFVRGLGYTPRVPYNITGGDEPYHSQNDDIRFSLLRDALIAGDSKAVWCLRGGYGCGRLISRLEKMTPPEYPKLVIGFSDATALHIFLMHTWQWPVLHAPVLFQLCNEKIEKNSAKRTLDFISGQMKELRYSHIEPLNKAAKAHFTIRAPLIGGNLSLLQTSIGTTWQINPEGAMVFLEECDEKGYAIDRMLIHLTQAGVFDKVRAILIGDCLTPSYIDDTSNINHALQRFAGDNPLIPILQIRGIGHGNINNPLPLGIPYTLTTGMDATLHCEVSQFYA